MLEPPPPVKIAPLNSERMPVSTVTPSQHSVTHSVALKRSAAKLGSYSDYPPPSSSETGFAETTAVHRMTTDPEWDTTIAAGGGGGSGGSSHLHKGGAGVEGMLEVPPGSPPPSSTHSDGSGSTMTPGSAAAAAASSHHITPPELWWTERLVLEAQQEYPGELSELKGTR